MLLCIWKHTSYRTGQNTKRSVQQMHKHSWKQTLLHKSRECLVLFQNRFLLLSKNMHKIVNWVKKVKKMKFLGLAQLLSSSLLPTRTTNGHTHPKRVSLCRSLATYTAINTAMDTAPAMAITTYHQCQEKAGGNDGPEGRGVDRDRKFSDTSIYRWRDI